MHRGAPSTLEPLKVLGEDGGSVLPFKTAVHYHELAFCTPLIENTPHTPRLLLSISSALSCGPATITSP